MDLCERIKKLCDLEHTTFYELEKSEGLGNGTISKWKTSTPKADILFKIATHFHVSMEYLLTGKEASHSVYSPEIRDFISRLVNLPSDYQKPVYDALRHAERDYEEDREKRKEA